MTIRLMKHYVTDGVTKARVHYHRGHLTNGQDCVTIYAKDYTRALGRVFADDWAQHENNSDLCSDYFEKSRVRIYADHPLWADACARAAR